jgi:lysophospholipase L1-like esterase
MKKPVQSSHVTKSLRAGWPLKLAVAVGSALLILVVGELCARFFARAWPFEETMVLPSHMTERDASLRWRFSATDGRNSLGLKNREIAPKATGTTRVLFLGDSLVWSGETSSGRLYTEVIEANLNERGVDDTRGFEVINAGIPGYTTYQELEFLRIYGLGMEPDLVVLCFVFNDVYFPYLHKPTAETALGSEPSHHLHHFDTRSFPGSLVARSYFAHLLHFAGERAGRRLFNRPRFQFQKRGDFYLAWKEHGWDHTERLLATMRQELADLGIGLMVVAFPIRDQVEGAPLERDRDYVLYPQRRLETTCDRLAIPMLDLTPALVEAGGTALFADTLHLNPSGNDVVAEVVTEHLVDGTGQTLISTSVGREP